MRVIDAPAPRPPTHCYGSPDGRHRFDRDRVCRVCMAADPPLAITAGGA